jgi:signal transduction histidine kinase
MIFIWAKKQLAFITILIVIDICSLFVFEILNPNFIPMYPSDWSRISDSYIGLLIILGFFSILVVSAKKSYIKEFKNAQKSDRLKSAFLANISHEIHTPLNAIMGFSELLARKEQPKEKRELYSKLIIENGNHLMKMVSDIVDISMIQTGQLKIDITQTDLHQLFVKLHFNYLQLLAKQEKKQINIILTEPTDDVVFYTDEIRLEQILTNLLSNAVKFTEKGHIKFGFKVINSQVVFFVEDTGIGIKEKKQAKIFERFAKDENGSNSKFTQGSGVGLALSKELVNLMGGEIWFDSEFMKGSTFYFSLPLTNTVYADTLEFKQHNS